MPFTAFTRASRSQQSTSGHNHSYDGTANELADTKRTPTQDQSRSDRSSHGNPGKSMSRFKLSSKILPRRPPSNPNSSTTSLASTTAGSLSSSRITSDASTVYSSQSSHKTESSHLVAVENPTEYPPTISLEIIKARGPGIVFDFGGMHTSTAKRWIKFVQQELVE